MILHCSDNNRGVRQRFFFYFDAVVTHGFNSHNNTICKKQTSVVVSHQLSTTLIIDHYNTNKYSNDYVIL